MNSQRFPNDENDRRKKSFEDQMKVEFEAEDEDEENVPDVPPDGGQEGSWTIGKLLSPLVLAVVIGSLTGALFGLIFGSCLGNVVWDFVRSWDSETAEATWWVIVKLSIWAGVVIFNCYFLTLGITGIVKEKRAENARRKNEIARRKAEQERRKAEQERRKAEQERCKAELADLLSRSHGKLRGLPVLITDAERHLDRAEQEFAEHVYSPFWDQIEHAVNKLAAYEQGIATINRSAIVYEEKTNSTNVAVPPFTLPMGELADGRPTARRLAALVRKAQKDPHFAQIYEQRKMISEQRKTNKILIAGFSTLSSALDQIGYAITTSLDDLSNNLHRSLDDLLDATRKHAEQARSASEKQQEMLDNIQRRRKPSP